MNPEYLYAMLDANGKCRVVTDQTTQAYPMSSLLEQGWVPIRETPLQASTGHFYVLILLERIPEEKKGRGMGLGL